MTARRLFHKENWSEVIKPKVVARMKEKYPSGPHTSKHPKWLKVMKRVEARLWKALPKSKRRDYEKRSLEINGGEESKEAKAECVDSSRLTVCGTDRALGDHRYAATHLRERLQKVLNDISKVFGVRVIAVVVRPGTGGQVLVSVYVLQLYRM